MHIFLKYSAIIVRVLQTLNVKTLLIKLFLTSLTLKTLNLRKIITNYEWSIINYFVTLHSILKQHH